MHYARCTQHYVSDWVIPWEQRPDDRAQLVADLVKSMNRANIRDAVLLDSKGEIQEASEHWQREFLEAVAGRRWQVPIYRLYTERRGLMQGMGNAAV